MPTRLQKLLFAAVVSVALYCSVHVLTQSDWNPHNPVPGVVADPCPQLLQRRATLDFTPGRPKILLASYPRSGNSWTRQILEKASGIMTGSIQVESWLGIKGSGLLGGAVVLDTIVVKTHALNTSFWHPLYGEALLRSTRTPPNVVAPPLPSPLLVIKSDAALLLVRNPFDSIYSNFQFFDGTRASNHTKSLLDPLTSQALWSEAVERYARGWADFHRWWLRQASASYPIHVMRYEDLKEDMEATIRKLFVFLKRPVDETRLACTLPAITCSALALNCREGHSGVQLRYYTKEHRRKVLAHVQPLMEHFGYPIPPLEDGEPYLRPLPSQVAPSRTPQAPPIQPHQPHRGKLANAPH